MRRLDRIGYKLFEKKLALADGFLRAGKQFRFDNHAEAEKVSNQYREKRGTCSDAIQLEILDFDVLGVNYPFEGGRV